MVHVEQEHRSKAKRHPNPEKVKWRLLFDNRVVEDTASV
jgi:hypothetical protein